MNINCLEGMICPKCGNEGPFDIVGTTTFRVSDDGVEDYEGAEWEDTSFCACLECHHNATVRAFKSTETVNQI